MPDNSIDNSVESLYDELEAPVQDYAAAAAVELEDSAEEPSPESTGFDPNEGKESISNESTTESTDGNPELSEDRIDRQAKLYAATGNQIIPLIGLLLKLAPADLKADKSELKGIQDEWKDYMMEEGVLLKLPPWASLGLAMLTVYGGKVITEIQVKKAKAAEAPTKRSSVAIDDDDGVTDFYDAEGIAMTKAEFKASRDAENEKPKIDFTETFDNVSNEDEILLTEVPTGAMAASWVAKGNENPISEKDNEKRKKVGRKVCPVCQVNYVKHPNSKVCSSSCGGAMSAKKLHDE